MEALATSTVRSVANADPFGAIRFAPDPATRPQGDRAACGWLFSPFDRFSKLALMELLGGSLDAHRLKGVFNVGTEWLLFNRVGGDLICESIPYCRDSRVEVILDQPCFDWDEFEKPLLKCLK